MRRIVRPSLQVTLLSPAALQRHDREHDNSTLLQVKKLGHSVSRPVAIIEFFAKLCTSRVLCQNASKHPPVLALDVSSREVTQSTVSTYRARVTLQCSASVPQHLWSL
jgi:hypothetical protein